jgi:hypothetical protein
MAVAAGLTGLTTFGLFNALIRTHFVPIPLMRLVYQRPGCQRSDRLLYYRSDRLRGGGNSVERFTEHGTLA